MMSEKSLLIAKEQIIDTIQRNRPEWSYSKTEEIAEQILKSIDWNNIALMHKGLEQIVILKSR